MDVIEITTIGRRVKIRPSPYRCSVPQLLLVAQLLLAEGKMAVLATDLLSQFDSSLLIIQLPPPECLAGYLGLG